jgi:hypothetical protein
MTNDTESRQIQPLNQNLHNIQLLHDKQYRVVASFEECLWRELISARGSDSAIPAPFLSLHQAQLQDDPGCSGARWHLALQLTEPHQLHKYIRHK